MAVLLSALHDEEGAMDRPFIEKRRNKRTLFAVPISCDGDVLKASNPDSFSLHGTVCDFSNEGLSFYTNMPVYEGEKITVLCSDIWDERKSCTIRWCSTLKFGLYKVGISLS